MNFYKAYAPINTPEAQEQNIVSTQKPHVLPFLCYYYSSLFS